ncbi:pectate lyase family protein [Gracilinema caldarium]|uniref:Pectate lyase/Amb allergen n=1 Tax=Gracilinema caldarium (strain ATCC 51460 / DSM 7334 / H1) TaxID=744872 RepID=F8EY67_GRAC1|nr:pectate lyase/Amb allergen [Gracilinema caldarium]AEJ18226.1 Pectate lyase/Amb allergen [Gracilinema caldarium DSM 7334]
MKHNIHTWIPLGAVLSILVGTSCCSYGINSVETAKENTNFGGTIVSGLSEKELVISPNDSSSGWVSYKGSADLAGDSVTPPSSPGGYGGIIYTVNNRAELLAALSSGSARIIYITSMIDMTEGMLPSSGNESSNDLDAFIAKYTAEAISSYSLSSDYNATSYSAWKRLYASKVMYTNNPSGDIVKVHNYLVNKWKSKIQIPVKSNTTIIGISSGCGIKGGTLVINNVQNVIIRNLLLQDAYDPFPALEANDGLNANYDGISIQQSKYIWIDHCTLEDTLARSDNDFDSVTTSDGTKTKWQVYDGLCDITKTNDFVTISWCVFKNHDKTMLIGSSDSYTADINHQTITLHHNYFLNCRQRLPMVRFATIHIYNNLYFMDATAGRTNSYAIGVRKDCSIVAENNYFAKGISYGFKDSYGRVYNGNNIFEEGVQNSSNFTSTRPWEPSMYYEYDIHLANNIPNLVMRYAGAGVLTVQK